MDSVDEVKVLGSQISKGSNRAVCNRLNRTLLQEDFLGVEGIVCL